MTIGAILLAFGVLSGPAWAIFFPYKWSDLASTEFPFGSPSDVAVDSRGRIYVAVTYYCRVQRYSPEGKFEIGWFVPSYEFALRTTPQDNVQIATKRLHSTPSKVLTYSVDGQLLSTELSRGDDLVAEFAAETKTTGNYAVCRGVFPHIVDKRNGQSVIANSWPKSLVAAPFPALGYVAVGIVLLGVGFWFRRCRIPSDGI